MQRVTGKLTTECTACHGWGHTKETAPTMRHAWRKETGEFMEVETIAVGSGCPKCLGLGQRVPT